MKKCIVNKGAFEFPLEYFGEVSTINNNFSNWNDQISILSITTELNTSDEISRVDGDYMVYMAPLANMEISSLDIVQENNQGNEEKEIIPIASFSGYNQILDLSTDCPAVENLYRGTIRFGRSKN